MSSVFAKTHLDARRSGFQQIQERWFLIFLFVYGAWVGLPFLAPVLMQVGWVGAGKSIYTLYSFFCHQLPERSFFLFGQKSMYSLAEIQAAWQDTTNPWILRQFIGNQTLGWKVAWSDRMISFYSSIWVFAAIGYPFRHKVRPLRWWAIWFLLVPITLDGLTHAISDMAGIGQGFRDTNIWLVGLTSHAFPESFYLGDGLGSFNSLMRIVTGILAGVGIAWLVFPYIFQTEAYNEQRNEKSVPKIRRPIQDQDPRAPGG